MDRRFEIFVTAINQIYRSIQRLKSSEMAALGLKGTHVMCLYQLQRHPEGLTSAQLCQLCGEDKAAISRVLSDLEERGLTMVGETPGQRRYRAPVTLTDAGRKIARQMDGRIMEAVQLGCQGYSDEERDAFYRVLLKIAENLQNDLPPESTDQKKTDPVGLGPCSK